MRQAEVYTNKCMAGILTETDDGKYIFRYNDSYLLDKNRQPYHYHFLKVNRNLFPILFSPSFIICFQRVQTKPFNAKRSK